MATVMSAALLGMLCVRTLAYGVAQTGRASAAADSTNATAVLSAVRGANPLACALMARALENRWGGSRHLEGPIAASLDEAQASAFGWALTSAPVDAVLPLLRGAMSDPDACVRRMGAALAGRVRGSALARAVAPELESPDANTREAAILALGYAADGRNEARLAVAARDAEPRPRRIAAWALGQTGSRAAVAPLENLLRDADSMVRVNAALALGTLSASDAVPALTAMLASDRDPRARGAAAAALGQIK
jgi:HEAT repeat protein